MKGGKLYRWYFLVSIFALFAFYYSGDSTQQEKAEITENPVIISVDSAEIKWVDQQIEHLTLEEKIAQFFMIAAYPKKGEDHYREIEKQIADRKIGGLIVFQGDTGKAKGLIKRFQKKSETPLLIAIDGEWGVRMRLSDGFRFPYQYTLGAANDTVLTREMGEMIGRECQSLGIHMNFTPVADVQSNIYNPVIGFRSFGEDPRLVSNHVSAMVKGIESMGVMTSIKHFPGHGDTDVDSHVGLPVVKNSFAHINAIDFPPFRAGIRSKSSSVMIGHLNVPALDPSGTPSSLSPIVIKKYLQGQLGFEGLVVSDALGMKAVADKYGKTEVVVKAFKAGCDILLMPESVELAIHRISELVRSGEISLDEINARCRKLLKKKYQCIISNKKVERSNNSTLVLKRKEIYRKAVTLIKNNDVLPFEDLSKRMLHIGVGADDTDFVRGVDAVSSIDHIHMDDLERMSTLLDTVKSYDAVVVSLHATTLRSKNNYGLPKGWERFIQQIPDSMETIMALFGNPFALKGTDLSSVDAVLVAYENSSSVQEMTGQMIMGAEGIQGHLPVYVSKNFPLRHGIEIQSKNRMRTSIPEEFNISSAQLGQIDSIVAKGIQAKAFPGCQVVVAYKGVVIYDESFGFHTYKKKKAVQHNDVYDIASITKIASTTASYMLLQSQQKFDLNKPVKTYLPDLVNGSSYGNLTYKEMLSHQAGLVPWIPFYTKTLSKGKLDPRYYRKVKSDSFSIPVATDLWMRTDYRDSIFKQILNTPLRKKRYKYSDVGYYFGLKTIEKITGKPINEYVYEQFYAPMGLKTMGYLPQQSISKSRILPTEDDKIFRKQQVKGYVHDQGTAMLGGVGGHAGLFSNARDLATMMQMFQDYGYMAGRQYIDSSVVKTYTGCQYCPTNRRGAGFDKPTRNLQGGPTCELVSLESFGHTGFTGTMAWSDPENEITFVFLSNRVYPDAENWKIVSMNIRTDIQKVIYQAIKDARKK